MYVCTSVSSLLSQKTHLVEEPEHRGPWMMKKFLPCPSACHQPDDGLFRTVS